jgi:diguanylate cyclase (GGDEF)-like protein/PAS domain S-box-containing protein
MSPDLLAVIRDPARLDALYHLNLLDSPAEETFDRLTRLAINVLHTPIALITFIDADRQFFKSSVGLPEPWASRREVPLSHSLCQHMLGSSEPLIVADTRTHALFKDNPAINDFQAIAYAGVPLITGDGYAIGSLCVVDRAPRNWPDTEIAILRDLAASVMSEIVLRSDTAERERVEQTLDQRARQQAAIADLGQRALVGVDLTVLFNDAIALVAETLDVEFCEALELMPDGSALRLRAGAGWREGMVGSAMVGTGTASLAGYTLFSDQPVIVDDLRTETRFQGPGLLRDHGIVNGVTVIIRGQEQPFGVLGAYTPRQRSFTSDDVHFLQSVANVLGTAVARKRAEQAISFQAHLLNMVEQAVIATDMRGMITYWNRFAERLYGWPAADALGRDMLALLSDESARREAGEMIARMRSGEHWAGEFRMRRQDGTIFPAYVIDSPIRDDQGALVGVVGVSTDMTERKRIEEIQREARDQLETQVAVRTAELREVNQLLSRWVKELEQRNSEVTLLSEMGELLQTCLNVEEAYSVLAQMLPRLFAAEAGALYIRADGQNFVSSIAAWGSASAQTFDIDACWALRRGRTHLVEPPGSGPICSHVGVHVARGYICVPVAAQDEILGILHVRPTSADADPLAPPAARSPIDTSGMTDSRRRLAVTVAEHAALALSNLKLRETLRQQAIRDPLTGLFNRRYMEESLEREVRRAARHANLLGVMMLDIDHFKRVNDSFGHVVGDMLLRAIGALLLSHTRGEDIACRYGGEEFTLILPDSSLADTWKRAEQLRSAVKQLRVRHGGEPLGIVTISVGVASFPEHGVVPEALLRAADHALYQAKAAGRDRVVKQISKS